MLLVRKPANLICTTRVSGEIQQSFERVTRTLGQHGRTDIKNVPIAGLSLLVHHYSRPPRRAAPGVAGTNQMLVASSLSENILLRPPLSSDGDCHWPRPRVALMPTEIVPTRCGRGPADIAYEFGHLQPSLLTDNGALCPSCSEANDRISYQRSFTSQPLNVLSWSTSAANPPESRRPKSGHPSRSQSVPSSDVRSAGNTASNARHLCPLVVEKERQLARTSAAALVRVEPPQRRDKMVAEE